MPKLPHSARLSARLRSAPTRYQPVARLASGGMAEVWRADAIFEDGQRHPVAIKRVRPELSDQQLLRSMFADEARLGMQLRHPNIVRVYDAREIEGALIIVMELVDGLSHKALLDRAHARGVPMPLAVSLHIVRELARALEYTHTARSHDGLHLGIIHRDISPHNVLLGKQGAVKLTDFGLADANVHETLRSQHLVGGKLGYLAPEVVHQEPADHRLDLFGLGIILWEMLAGRRLFQGQNDNETVRNVKRCEVPPLESLYPGLPRQVCALGEGLLARDPAQRLDDAGKLREMLDGVIQRLEPDVGSRDVSLLVGLSSARRQSAPPPAPTGVEALARELEAFVQQSEQGDSALGAAPLDPSQFARPHGSGVRSWPDEK